MLGRKVAVEDNCAKQSDLRHGKTISQGGRNEMILKKGVIRLFQCK
jgi:hypothetical protein